MTRRRGSFWPSPQQELLLRSALAEPGSALEAYQRLRPHFALQDVEPGTFPVLPLLYRAFSQIAPEDPDLPRLKGIYRNSWVRNNLMVEALAQVHDALGEAGVEAVMIGSLAAATRYYPELALRPTPTLELVVAREDLVAAVRALGRLGWSAAAPVHASTPEPVGMANPAGQGCLLLTAITPDFAPSLPTLAAATVELEFGGRSVRAVSPADDLLLACVRGARVWPVRSVQWLVDIVQILRSTADEVDWERLLDLAAQHLQTVRLEQALGYLEELVGVPLPAAPASRRRPVGRRERLAYRCGGASVPGLGGLPQALGEHLCRSRDLSPLDTAGAFPGFLRQRWEVERNWQLPAVAARRALRGRRG